MRGLNAAAIAFGVIESFAMERMTRYLCDIARKGRGLITVSGYAMLKDVIKETV